MQPFRVISARTTHSNTPESDQQPEVLHDVTVFSRENGIDGYVQIMATEPSDALDRAHKLSLEEVRALLKPHPATSRRPRP